MELAVAFSCYIYNFVFKSFEKKHPARSKTLKVFLSLFFEKKKNLSPHYFPDIDVSLEAKKIAVSYLHLLFSFAFIRLPPHSPEWKGYSIYTCAAWELLVFIGEQISQKRKNSRRRRGEGELLRSRTTTERRTTTTTTKKENEKVSLFFTFFFCFLHSLFLYSLILLILLHRSLAHCAASGGWCVCVHRRNNSSNNPKKCWKIIRRHILPPPQSH